MTCREFTAFIIDYYAGELPVGTVASFELHLALCPNCVQYLRQYETTVSLERAAFSEPDGTLPAEVPEELVQAILAARRDIQ
jgi:anti-sigma factor RsiW